MSDRSVMPPMSIAAHAERIEHDTRRFTESLERLARVPTQFVDALPGQQVLVAIARHPQTARR